MEVDVATTVAKTYKHDKKVQRKAEAEIIRRLEELGGKMFDDDDVLYEGTKLIIPESMTIDHAIRFLERKREEMEAVTEYTRAYNYRPFDGAYCMWNAMKRAFGVVGHRGTMGFWGPNPPEMITVDTDVGKQEQIPWGRFDLPFLPGATFETQQINNRELGPLFQITAWARKKHRFKVEGVFRLVAEELATRSMYRGKAFDGRTVPQFVDLSGITPDKVVYSQDVLTQLRVNIWSQLDHTDQMEGIGMPLKRAVLVHGPYGTGKTLAAMLTAQRAIANGWTFIKARPGHDDLDQVLQTARLYQPSVVFYEDVDQIANTDQPNSDISRLLDDFDGIEAKNTKILVVLTTNHAERIHKAMARPGRLDAMIHIDELDKEGVEKLVRTRVGDLLTEDVDWDAVFDAAKGYRPAFVTEFADRAIRYVVAEKGGVEGNTISGQNLIDSANGLRPQYELMEGAKDVRTTARLDQALVEALHPTVLEAADSAVRENVIDKFLKPEPVRRGNGVHSS
jgi:transitional endoplasmic reticulum ATPase